MHCFFVMISLAIDLTTKTPSSASYPAMKARRALRNDDSLMSNTSCYQAPPANAKASTLAMHKKKHLGGLVIWFVSIPKATRCSMAFA